MQRLTRSELASRLTPFAPGDAFWARALAAGEAAIGVGPDAIADWASDETENDTDGNGADEADEGGVDDHGSPDGASARPRGRSHATIERVEGRGTVAAPGPLATGDMIDVGERSFVVVGVDRTAAGGVTYRLHLVPERDAA